MKYSYLILCNLLISNAYADFCPGNFRPIHVGDTINQVISQCGKPSQQTSKKVPAKTPEEWDYYIKQTVASNTSYQTTGTLKTSIAFDADGKAINISVNGVGVGGTSICNDQYIQLGATQDQVKAACGSPSNINKQTLSQEPKNDVYTTLNYNTNPPKTLTFKNGIMTSTGQ